MDQFREGGSIVTYSGNPVGSGLVESLAHPGGNITGFGAGGIELLAKYFEVLHEIDPSISRVGFLTDDAPYGPGSNEGHAKIIRQAFDRYGITTIGEHLPSPYHEAAIRRVVAAMVRDNAKALMADGTPANLNNASLIVSLADEYRLPVVSGLVEITKRGGLVSYCPDEEDNYRQLAIYVDQILKGKKPAELPFQQPTKFKLIINMNTAKKLGLSIPPSLIARADEVIDP